MVKKISVFITILGLFFLGIPQFNSKALIYDGVDYRILETGTPIEIYGNQFNPIVINEDNGGATIGDWLNYMQINDIHRIEMQASDLSTFYFYFDTNEQQIMTNVFKVELGYDTGFAFFYMRLYGLNQSVLSEITLAYNLNQWELPSNTRVLTNLNFQSNQDIYDDAYRQGYDAAWNDADDYIQYSLDSSYDAGYDIGYDHGYDTGYDAGLLETDATGFVSLLGAVFGGLGSLLSIELLPGIHIGAIIAVPLVFGIIFFILGKRKGD